MFCSIFFKKHDVKTYTKQIYKALIYGWAVYLSSSTYDELRQLISYRVHACMTTVVSKI
jgi:hypothetical protein